MCGATSKAQFLTLVVFLTCVVATYSVNVRTIASSSSPTPTNFPTERAIPEPTPPKFPGDGYRLGGEELGQMGRDRQVYHAALKRAKQAREAINDVDDIIDIVDDLEDVSWDKTMEMLDDYVDTFDPAPRQPQLPPGLEKKLFADRMKKLMNRPGFKGTTDAVDTADEVIEAGADAVDDIDRLREIYSQPGYKEVAADAADVVDDVAAGADVLDDVAAGADVVDDIATVADVVDDVAAGADVVDDVAAGMDVVDDVPPIGVLHTALEKTTNVVSEICTRTKCYQVVEPLPSPTPPVSTYIGPAITGAVASYETYNEYQKNGDTSRAVTTFGTSVAKSTGTALAAAKACGLAGFAGPGPYGACVLTLAVGANYMGAVPDTSTVVDLIHGSVDEENDSDCESNGMKTPDGLIPSCEECKQKAEWDGCGITNDEGDDSETEGNSLCFTYCEKVE